MDLGAEAARWRRAGQEARVSDLAPAPSKLSWTPTLPAGTALSVLDLGCGSGRHLLRLQAQIFSAAGVVFAGIPQRQLRHLDQLESELRQRAGAGSSMTARGAAGAASRWVGAREQLRRRSSRFRGRGVELLWEERDL